MILTLVPCLRGQCFALGVICYTAPLVRGHRISLELQPCRNSIYKLNYAKFLFRFRGQLINELVSNGGRGGRGWLVLRVGQTVAFGAISCQGGLKAKSF